MSAKKKFFITTPIYYSNDIPHIGHAYSSFIADVYARFHRMLGYDVKFSTWVDENSQKTVQKAAEQGLDTMEYLDLYAWKHQAIWDALRVSYTDFIRTTSPKHKEFVQQVLQKVYDNGDIYQGEYEWLYCVWCEAFKKESDVVSATGEYEWIATWTMVCPDHPNRQLDKIKEKNWFFKLSKYETQLKEYYGAHDDFVQPHHRYNEVIAFTNGWLEDFSISRETNKFWIPLPFDESHVTYVWFDALLNYITVCQGWDEAYRSSESEKYHVLWKDIVRFHAIYWPAMLISAGMDLPNKEIVTWFFTVDNQKMSKSLGNVVNPVEVVERYGRDALVYYLLNDMSIGSDGDFSWDRFKTTFDSHLIGWWGNLVSRVTNIAAKNGIMRGKKSETYNRSIDFSIPKEMNLLRDYIIDCYKDTNEIKNIYLWWVALNQFCKDWYEIVQECNELMQRTEPRKLFKDEATRPQAGEIIEHLLYVIKQLAILSSPILLDSTQKVFEILGNEDLKNSLSQNELLIVYWLEEFTVNLTPGILYTRVE
jgi:methionyl-tRNA synthetase